MSAIKCDVSLRLTDVQILGIPDANQISQKLQSRSLTFGYDDGKVTAVCPSNEDDQWSVNIKKSIVSALQMSANSKSSKSFVSEVDISGHCETIYEPILANGTVVRKVKTLNTCKDRQQLIWGLYPRRYCDRINAIY